DGKTDGDFEVKSTTHTREENNPWWEVDLDEEKNVDSIVIWNRTDGEVGSRLANFRVLALDASRKEVWTTQVATAPSPSLALKPDEMVIGLKRATATHNQKDFEVSRLTDNRADAKDGWGIGGGEGKAQTALFEFAS